METSTFSIFTQLLEKRVVTVGHPIDDQLANLVIAQLLYLESEDAGRPIQLYVRSPGGSLTNALAIRETMINIKPDVGTVAVGEVSGAATLLVAAGHPGSRLGRPDCSLTVCDPSGERDVKRFRQFLCSHTGQSLKKISDLCRQQTPLNGDEALRLGLLDYVIAAS